MTNTVIIISDNLRVVDYDDKQYAIERRSVVQTGENAGDVRWAPFCYCGSVSALPELVRRNWVGDVVTAARDAANAEFAATGLTEKLLELPAKTRGG